MCLYIVDNVSTCRIIYFRYVDTENHIDNSPSFYHQNIDFSSDYLRIIPRLICICMIILDAILDYR